MGNPALLAKALRDSAVGAGELGLHMASGMVATPVGGIAGLVAALRGKGLQGAGDAQAEVADALTYQPRTEAGADTVAGVQEGMGAVRDMLHSPAMKLMGMGMGAVPAAILATGAEVLPAALNPEARAAQGAKAAALREPMLGEVGLFSKSVPKAVAYTGPDLKALLALAKTPEDRQAASQLIVARKQARYGASGAPKFNGGQGLNPSEQVMRDIEARATALAAKLEAK